MKKSRAQENYLIDEESSASCILFLSAPPAQPNASYYYHLRF